jgi:predicted DsbA family dithiol-disulfide isomerase
MNMEKKKAGRLAEMINEGYINNQKNIESKTILIDIEQVMLEPMTREQIIKELEESKERLKDFDNFVN